MEVAWSWNPQDGSISKLLSHAHPWQLESSISTGVTLPCVTLCWPVPTGGSARVPQPRHVASTCWWSPPARWGMDPPAMEPMEPPEGNHGITSLTQVVLGKMGKAQLVFFCWQVVVQDPRFESTQTLEKQTFNAPLGVRTGPLSFTPGCKMTLSHGCLMGWFNYWGRFTLCQAVRIWSVAVSSSQKNRGFWLCCACPSFCQAWMCHTKLWIRTGMIWFTLERVLSSWKATWFWSWELWIHLGATLTTNINNHCHSTRAVSLAWPLAKLVSFGGFYALHARCDSYLRPFMYFMIVSGLRGSTLS